MFSLQKLQSAGSKTANCCIVIIYDGGLVYLAPKFLTCTHVVRKNGNACATQ